MAAKGNNIFVAGDPDGVSFEGIIADGVTPKPGTIMEIKTATEPDGTGRFTWEPYGTTAASGANGVAADGDRRLIAVLLPDKYQGKDATTAYAAGDRCFLRIPKAGETLNVLMLDISGTGDDFAIGDTLMVNDGDGKVIAATGDPESEPFQCLSTVTNPLADHLMWVMYTGQ